MMRSRSAANLCALGLLSALVSAAGAQPTAATKPPGVTITFQQGVGGYEGCVTVDQYGTAVKQSSANIDKMTLKFTGLKLPGKNPKVVKARLLTYFQEEAYTRIKTATLEIADASAKDGPALDTVKFAQPMPERVTRQNKWLPWDLPAALVQKWIEEPASNKGILFRVKPDQEGLHQFFFTWTANDETARRPILEVTFTFEGDVPPNLPQLVTSIDGKTLGKLFAVEWNKISFDLLGLPCRYEVELAADGTDDWKKASSVEAEKLAADVDTSALTDGGKYKLRVSAVNSKGLRGEYAIAKGAFRVTRKTAAVWATDSVTKVAREENPPGQGAAVALSAARNEYQSFQVVVSAFSNTKEVDVAIDDLAGPGGAKIASSGCTLYRVHYVDCRGKGWHPDSMVPFIDPQSKKRIGGKFGAPFDVAAGTNAPVWVEVFVPANAAPGVYKGSVHVTAGGKEIASVPVELTVYPVTLPKTSTLLTFFELSQDTPKRDYMQALHNHRIDIWSFREPNHSFDRADGKVVMKWNADLDKAIDAYFDGSLFADGVPGKTYLLRGVWEKGRNITAGSDEDRIEILKQFHEHYKGKPYASRMWWFFIDEPKADTIAKCVRVGKQIKEYSPGIGLLLTTRYNKQLVGLVDVWDAIINAEVIDWNAPGPDPYREEMKLGRTCINCITVNSNTPTSPNLFIHHKGMNTRIWPWVTFALDQQGLEFWDTKPAPSVTVPKVFGGTAWGDGSLFYKGLPAELGVAEEIPLPSIRLKMLREGIQDFELLSMVRKKDAALSRKLAHRMVQETKDYDKSFEQAVQHVSWSWNTDGKGDRQVPGFVVWESSPTRLAAARAEILKALSENSK